MYYAVYVDLTFFSSIILDEAVKHCVDSEAEEIKDSKEPIYSNIGAAIKPCNKKYFLVDSIVAL